MRPRRACFFSSPLARGVVRSTGVSSAGDTARPRRKRSSPPVEGCPTGRGGLYNREHPSPLRSVAMKVSNDCVRRWRACVSPADCVLAASYASLGLVSPHLRCHSCAGRDRDYTVRANASHARTIAFLLFGD